MQVLMLTRISVPAQEMIRPGLLAVLSPCAVGLGFRALGYYTGQTLLGAKAVAGLLMFSMVAGDAHLIAPAVTRYELHSVHCAMCTPAWPELRSGKARMSMLLCVPFSSGHCQP